MTLYLRINFLLSLTLFVTLLQGRTVLCLTGNVITSSTTKILWFRSNSLRIKDNDAIVTAIEESRESDSILPIYLWNTDDVSSDGAPVNSATGGTASDVFLAQVLHALNRTLSGNLQVGILESENRKKGVVGTVHELQSICAAINATEIFYLQSHDDEMEKRLFQQIVGSGLTPRPFNNACTLLDYAKVVVPWKEIIMRHTYRSPLIPYVDYVEEMIKEHPIPSPHPEPAPQWKNLLWDKDAFTLGNPMKIDKLLTCVGVSKGGTEWKNSILNEWGADESSAGEALDKFLTSLKMKDTDIKRTHLESRLSPYLARGIISARQVYYAIKRAEEEGYDVNSLMRRICWRDYTHAVTRLYPDILEGRVIREEYVSHIEDNISSERENYLLQQWKKGQTGFPLVDAGMRQLRIEGWMPQKVRLAASTCLIEGLGVSWDKGMEHFKDFLVDYDERINTNMWMNAGCVGFDPYYIGMNYKRRPYWDKDGDYVRKWIPEMEKLPDSIELPEQQRGVGSYKVDCLYQPWAAPDEVLQEANVVLGQSYPERICDERKGRIDFLSSLKRCRDKWDPSLKDEKRRDVISLGRDKNAERIGIFTPVMIK